VRQRGLDGGDRGGQLGVVGGGERDQQLVGLRLAVGRQAHAGGQLEVQRGGHRDQHGADAVPGADVPADLHQADRVGVDAAPQGDVPDALAVVHLAGRYRTKRLSGEGLGLARGRDEDLAVRYFRRADCGVRVIPSRDSWR
jgi:hypothetical protein